MVKNPPPLSCAQSTWELLHSEKLTLTTTFTLSPAPFMIWVHFGRLLNHFDINSTFPTHISYGHSLLTDRKEICSACNSHFAASGHLFENTMNEVNHILKPQAAPHGNTSPPSLSMSSFSLREVFDAVLMTATRKSSGVDHFDALF